MSKGNKSQAATAAGEQKKGVVAEKKTFSKDGIAFGKGGRPTFKKSEHVGNKSEFPELGNEQPGQSQNEQSKANYSGGISGLASAATAKNTNKFESLQEGEKPERKPYNKDQPREYNRDQPREYNRDQNKDYGKDFVRGERRPPREDVKAEEKTEESGEPKQRPKFNFGGLKKTIGNQNEENKEANEGLAEYQEKLKRDIKIHEAKKPRDQVDTKKEEEEPEFE